MRLIFNNGYSILLLMLVMTSCATNDGAKSNGKLNVVCTTSMITDMAKELGGEDINIEGLMGAGVDPHLYKASEGDVGKLVNADMVFYNGLHLEGKLVEVFQKMKSKKTIALSDRLDKTTLISSALFASNYDPHVWFDVENWIAMSEYMCEVLIVADDKHKANYEARRDAYIVKLRDLHAFINDQVSSIPVEKRILVTAHDAFGYFGKQYGFEVVGLQGLSTATEAGVKDVQRLASFIIEHRIHAIFVESSVPKRTIESLQAAVLSKGHEVSIGGTLYSDALGDLNTIEGTYIGMFQYNVKTIINALR